MEHRKEKKKRCQHFYVSAKNVPETLSSATATDSNQCLQYLGSFWSGSQRQVTKCNQTQTLCRCCSKSPKQPPLFFQAHRTVSYCCPIWVGAFPLLSECRCRSGWTVPIPGQHRTENSGTPFQQRQ